MINCIWKKKKKKVSDRKCSTSEVKVSWLIHLERVLSRKQEEIIGRLKAVLEFIFESDERKKMLVNHCTRDLDSIPRDELEYKFVYIAVARGMGAWVVDWWNFQHHVHPQGDRGGVIFCLLRGYHLQALQRRLRVAVALESRTHSLLHPTNILDSTLIRWLHTP